MEKIPRLGNVTRMIALQMLDYGEYDEDFISDEVEEVVSGAQIIPKGQSITWPLLQGLSNFVRQIRVVEPIAVQVEVVGEESGSGEDQG